MVFILGSLNYGIISILAALVQNGPPPSPPRARLVTTTAAAAATIALVVARAIFMRRNPGGAKDGSVKVFIVARVIFERRKPKRHAAARRPGREPDPGQGPSPTHQHMRTATTRGLPPTAPIPTPPKVSSSTVSSSSRALWTFGALAGAAGPVTVVVDK